MFPTKISHHDFWFTCRMKRIINGRFIRNNTPREVKVWFKQFTHSSLNITMQKYFTYRNKNLCLGGRGEASDLLRATQIFQVIMIRLHVSSSLDDKFLGKDIFFNHVAIMDCLIHKYHGCHMQKLSMAVIYRNCRHICFASKFYVIALFVLSSLHVFTPPKFWQCFLLTMSLRSAFSTEKHWAVSRFNTGVDLHMSNADDTEWCIMAIMIGGSGDGWWRCLSISHIIKSMLNIWDFTVDVLKRRGWPVEYI